MAPDGTDLDFGSVPSVGGYARKYEGVKVKVEVWMQSKTKNGRIASLRLSHHLCKIVAPDGTDLDFGSVPSVGGYARKYGGVEVKIEVWMESKPDTMW